MAGVIIDLTGITLGVTISGGADLDITQSGAVSIPSFTVSGYGTLEYNFSSLEIPKLGVDSTGLVGVVGKSGLITLPRLILHASDNYPVLGSGSVQIPIFATDSIALVGIVGTGGIVIPLPFFSVDALGHIDSIVSGDVLIPVLSIRGFAFMTMPNEIYKAIVMNAFNYSVTEYYHYNFNSFAKFGETVVAAGPNGVYTLDDSLNEGNPIYAEFRTGLDDFRQQFYKYIRELWFTLKTNGQLEIVIQVGEEIIWNHDLEIFKKVLHEVRGKVARGLRDRYFGFGIRNVNGSDFDADSIRVKVEIVRGRIR